MEGLDEWLDRQARVSFVFMSRAISATQIIKDRAGFGQRVVPRAGSVVASPVPAAYDPDPDYFFHWFRDSAIVMRALRVCLAEGWATAEALQRFREFVEFSLSLRALDGRALLMRDDFKSRVAPSFLQYVRADPEIAAISGPAVFAETRVNPDGSLDITRWPRPQTDGPALRLMTVLDWERSLSETDLSLRSSIRELAICDLDFMLIYADEPSFDIWEEESGRHYYTCLVQAEALARGAEWLASIGEQTRAQACRSAGEALALRLDEFWDPGAGYYRSRVGVASGQAEKALDIAVVLGVLHAGRSACVHGVLDPKAQATLSALEQLFEAEYEINRNRSAGMGPALGRYKGDVYYSGGAYYFSTLAAAEFYFRLASALASGAALAATDENERFRLRLGIDEKKAHPAPALRALARGDAIMRMVQVFTPETGELSEQFDQTTGAQTSAEHLAWSYAALITAAASRRLAYRATQGAGPPGTQAGPA